jgi:hypothetical protein
MKDRRAQKPPNVPAGARVQLVVENVAVTPVTVELTAPVGTEPPGPLVSVTTTIQNVGCPTAAEVGMHPREVKVVRVPSTVTVRLTVVGVVVAPRGEPVTWKLYEPGVTVDATLTVKSLAGPYGKAITGLTLKEAQVMPVGREELTQDNVTG